MAKETDMNALIPIVTKKIFADLPKSLYPGLLQSIQKSVREEFLSRISHLEKQVQNLEARLGKLEARATNNVKTTSQPSLLGSLLGFGRQEVPPVNMDSFEIRNGFRYNGWIYYSNPEQANFLYRVREDGSGNTQLTNYSVLSVGFRVVRGTLYFSDAKYHEHSIRVG